MDSIGLDLHKRESQLCFLTEAGDVLERRIVTSAAAGPEPQGQCVTHQLSTNCHLSLGPFRQGVRRLTLTDAATSFDVQWPAGAASEWGVVKEA